MLPSDEGLLDRGTQSPSPRVLPSEVASARSSVVAELDMVSLRVRPSTDDEKQALDIANVLCSP